MSIEQGVPRPVTEAAGQLGRTDNVGEQDGSQHTVGFGRRAAPGDERFDLGHQLILVSQIWEMVFPRKLHVSGSGKVFGDESTLVDASVDIVSAVQDQARHRYRGQHRPHVILNVSSEIGHRIPRRRTVPLEPGPP